MARDRRTNRDLLICIETKQVQHGKDIGTLQNHFENHLTEHKEDLKAKLKYQRTVKLIMLSAAFTAFCSFIVGLVLLFLK